MSSTRDNLLLKKELFRKILKKIKRSTDKFGLQIYLLITQKIE